MKVGGKVRPHEATVYQGRFDTRMAGYYINLLTIGDPTGNLYGVRTDFKPETVDAGPFQLALSGEFGHGNVKHIPCTKPQELASCIGGVIKLSSSGSLSR